MRKRIISDLPGSIVTICKKHGELTKENSKKTKNNKYNREGFRCRKCVNIYTKNVYLKKNREKIRAKERLKASFADFKEKRKNRLLLKDFGITIHQYKEILSKQNNVCKICNKEDPIRNLAVDHCHQTGKIRGLLCQKCNTSLGNFQDSIEILEAAIRYLKSNL